MLGLVTNLLCFILGVWFGYFLAALMLMCKKKHTKPGEETEHDIT